MNKKEIEQLLFMIRQKIEVARNAKRINQLGLYRYSVESAETLVEQLETLVKG